MRLAISNIAWPQGDEPAVADELVALGLDAVEVAPTTRFPAPLTAPEAEVHAYRRFWNDRGIEIVALQALLYGRPELTIFEDPETRQSTLGYLCGIMRMAAELGAGKLAFGSPRNRQVGRLDPVRAQVIAVDFFGAAAEAAEALGLVLCIEPNPAAYGCDFVTHVAQGVELVRAVDRPGFALQIDAGGMTMSGERLVEAVTAAADRLEHYHAGEPNLGPVGEGGADHATLARELARIGYDKVVSVEMRAQPERDTVPEIRRAVGYLRSTYGDPNGLERKA